MSSVYRVFQHGIERTLDCDEAPITLLAARAELYLVLELAINFIACTFTKNV